MKITLVISSLSFGGAERVLSNMANYWSEKGWRIVLLTLDDGKIKPFYKLHTSIEHRPLGLSGTSANHIKGVFNNIKRIWALRQAIKKSAPEVVISFMDRTNVLTLLATLALNYLVIVSERSNPSCHSIGRGWNFLRYLSYRFSSSVVVQTQDALNFFPEYIQRRTYVIPNPVNIPAFENGFIEKNNKKKIIAMGRLSNEKGYDLLIKAFSKVFSFHTNWTLTIWGDGPLRSDLEKLRDRLKLQGLVDFPGITQQPFEKMRQADIFVLSSRYEGFPNVLCEAMACGLPVISFDCPSGPRDIIRNDIDGILVPPENVDALANALNKLMIDEKERKRLGKNALEVSSRFSLEKVMAMWESLLALSQNNKVN